MLMEEKIKHFMEALDITEAEANELIAYDKQVDRMKDSEVANDLTAEQKKIVKKMSSTGVRKTPTTYQFSKRERKPNATKEGIIAELAKFLAENSENAVKNCEIVNKNRLIHFAVGDKEFDLTLIEKRLKS